MTDTIQVRLFGASGERTTEVPTRGGFSTRHVKAPHQTVLAVPEAVPPKVSDVAEASQDVPAPTLLEVLHYMEATENHSDWLIIDEILFVATAHYDMKFSHRSLLDALRRLYQQGLLAYRRNRFDQHTFRLIENQETNLKVLLTEVDSLLGEGRDA